MFSVKMVGNMIELNRLIVIIEYSVMLLEFSMVVISSVMLISVKIVSRWLGEKCVSSVEFVKWLIIVIVQQVDMQCVVFCLLKLLMLGIDRQLIRKLLIDILVLMQKKMFSMFSSRWCLCSVFRQLWWWFWLVCLVVLFSVGRWNRNMNSVSSISVIVRFMYGFCMVCVLVVWQVSCLVVGSVVMLLVFLIVLDRISMLLKIGVMVVFSEFSVCVRVR